MNGRTAAEVSLGVAGIYLLASSVPACAAVFAGVLTNGSAAPFSLWVGLTGPAATAVSAIVLLSARGRLAAWLCPNTDQSGEAIAPDALHAAAISVVGILFFAGGVAGLAREVTLVGSQ